MSKLKRALDRAKEIRKSGGGFDPGENISEEPNRLKKALEKRAATSRLESRGAAEARDVSSDATLEVVDEKPKSQSDVRISYSKTKVTPVDLKKLKDRKLISLFQGSDATEQIKTLRTQILSKLKEIGGNSLLITSANPGEGKTFTSINLGISIAQELERTVLLVDADLRQPLNGHFDFAKDFFCVDVNSGLSDYLTEKIDIPELLLNPGIQKLTILPGGKYLANSTELLGSARMERLVKEMKNRYKDDRVIIFDTSSILQCPDPLELSKFVDGILLVVEEEKTSADQLKRVMELLKDRRVLGTVLNKSRFSY